MTRRARDTETALGAGVMTVALKGYTQLKLHGKNQGLDSLRQALGSRFARSVAARSTRCNLQGRRDAAFSFASAFR